MDYTQARKELANLISHNKDDLGRTITSGLITDFLDWHQTEVKKLNIASVSGKRILSIEWQAKEAIERLTTLTHEVDELKAACASGAVDTVAERGMQIKVPTAQEYIDFMKKMYDEE